MEYETIGVAGPNDTVQQHVIIQMGDGAYKSIHADESNPEYVAFLESLNDNTETE